MKTLTLYIIGALFACDSVAFARIGENEEQIEARYGKPLGALSGLLGEGKGYASGGFVIAVTYLNGISQDEIFTKRDRGEITATEIDVLLAANAGGFRWGGRHLEGQRVIPGLDEYRSLDQRSRVAFYNRSDHSLFISTQDYIDKLAAKQAEIAVQNLKRF